MTEFGKDDQAMLGLAALTYRGVGDGDEAEIRRKLVPWLPKLEAAGLGRWDLVWGPAVFRSPISLFDDSMAYVVRDLDAKPVRYAVVIRGTNPMSIFDWVVGDLWVDQLVPWPHGPLADRTTAQISGSSFLSLRILQSLRSEPESTSGSDNWFGRFRKRFGNPVSRGLGRVLETLVRESSSRTNLLLKLDWKQVLRNPDTIDLKLLTDIAKFRPRGVKTVSRLLRQLDSSGSVGKRAAQASLDAMLGVVKTAAAKDRGVHLSEFLADVVSETPDAEINVTGHSKGGALANVVALWLADTQGSADEWDPRGEATVRCYSFAGPTAGNAAFAAHFDTVFGPHSRRIMNVLDVVPYAWEPAELRKIANLYQPGMATPHPFPALVEYLAAMIGRHGFKHVGHKVDFDPGVDPSGQVFLAQVIQQHLDAYLKWITPNLRFDAIDLMLDG